MDKDIDYVVAVAECRSISKAADILFISQPSLSRYISKLEQDLGLKLFFRSGSGVNLTEAGQFYIDDPGSGTAIGMLFSVRVFPALYNQ